MRSIPNTTTQAEYVAATTFGGGPFSSGQLTIANESAFIRLTHGPHGQTQQTSDIPVTPGTFSLVGTQTDPLWEVAVRDAVSGSHAQFYGALFGFDEAGIAGGQQFTGTVSASGAFTPPGGSAIQYDIGTRTTNLNVAAVTEATATVIVSTTGATYDGATRVNIEFFCPQLDPTAGGTHLVFYSVNGSTTTYVGQAFVGGGGTTSLLTMRAQDTPPSGATTVYTVAGFVAAGTAVVHAGAGGSGLMLPAFLRIYG